MKDKVLDIYSSDWSDALADAAYFLLSQKHFEYIDKYELKRDLQRYEELMAKLKDLDSEKDWETLIDGLIARIAFNYLSERMTGKNFSAGGFLTLIGHSSHLFINWGFLAYVASSLDSGKAQVLYNKYISIDEAFQNAIKFGDSATGYELAEKWRVSQNEIGDAHDHLIELLGLTQEY